jgi:hypothetical protein
MTRRMIAARLVLGATTLWLASLVAATRAHAGAISACGGQPFAFRDADVNVVILPYFQSGLSPRSLNGLGSQLALLVKLETLYRAMTYDRWGIVLLTGRKEECDAERIATDLLLTNMIRPGGRLIMVWGKLYQQDQDVYVQTFAKTYRNPPSGEKVAPPELGMQLGGKTFLGRIGGDEFAFPPEQLPIKVMDAIADNFRKAVFVYDKPDVNSNKHPIPLDQFRKCDNCQGALAFTVQGREGNWIHVKGQGNWVGDGYLLAHLDEANSLDRQMPEIGFLQGLMGFLRYTGQAPQGEQSRSSAGMQVAEQALTDYARREEAAQEPETKAAAMQLTGILEFARSKKDSSEQFDVAYQLVPYSSDARNLAAVFRLYRVYNSPAKNLRPLDIANDFVAAVALDPRNSLVLANLQSFYELLAAPESNAKVNPDLAISASEIQARLAKVKEIRQSLAAGNRPGN